MRKLMENEQATWQYETLSKCNASFALQSDNYHREN
jgi:hypothetical protein